MQTKFAVLVSVTLAACSTTQTHAVSAEDVAYHAGVDGAAPPSSWQSLCSRKECDGPSLTYTMLSREAATLHDATSRLVQVEAAGELNANDHWWVVVDLLGVANELRGRVETVDPARDFAGDARQSEAVVLARHARYQVLHAKNRIERLYRCLEDTGAKPPAPPGDRPRSWPALP